MVTEKGETIRIKESLYKRLKEMKRSDESFGDLIERLIEKKAPSYDELANSISKESAKAIREMKEEKN
ncbi:MAG: DNA binding protein containing RHH/copG family domain [Candidatus Methanohalarchaeum thermophilum]|uniref:DNA binding protein containing RHH/copG family domain n=1 Tax=Methanohalarchaeum thermophilum TaxID=1903181 RepID=A0A1Q6DSW3_METT1|nr:MAG: DNA binding protein containing RHH/copG family domain [Candidatus Methanohalarchaeum thermophilum]